MQCIRGLPKLDLHEQHMVALSIISTKTSITKVRVKAYFDEELKLPVTKLSLQEVPPWNI